MAEKISVQIELGGAKEVEQQLADIGAAGQKSFDQIGAAGDQANAGIAKTGEAAEKAAQSTSKLSLETVKTSAEIAKLAVEIGLTGVEIVQAVRHHDTLIQSLLKLASGANTAVKAFSLIAPELTVVGAGALAIAGPIAAAVTAFEALEKVATKFAASTEKISNTFQILAATSGQSFDSLQRGEAAFGQIGISAETFRGTVAKVQETLAKTDVTNLTRGMRDIVALVNEIAAGQKGITFADWVTVEDKINGVAIAMKQAADQGRNATQVLLEFLRSADLATAIKVGAAFGLSEADVDRVRRFKEDISDLTQRLQDAPVLISPAAAAAFDRMRTSVQSVDSAWARLKQSIDSTIFTSMAASLSATMNEMKASVINFAATAVERLNSLGNEAIRIGAQIGAGIGQAFKELGQQTGLTAFFQQFGTEARNAVTVANGAIADFVGRVMQGAGASASAIKAVQDQINGIAPVAEKAGQAAQAAGITFTAWGETIKTVGGQGAGLNTAAAAATAAGQAAQAAGITFTAWGETIKTVGGQGAAAGQAVAQAGQAGAQAAQQGASATKIWIDGIGAVDSQAATTSQTLQQTGEAAQQAGTAQQAFFAPLSSIDWSVISGVGVGAWNTLTSAIQFAIDKLQQFIGLKPTPPATGGGAPGKARGGLLGGRGTGTSDSNLAWLSRGEFVVRAAAVRKYGASLFAALNAGRFAAGGLVGGGGTETITVSVDNIARAIETNTQAIESQSQVIMELGRIISGLTQTTTELGRSVVDVAQQQSQIMSGMGDVRNDVQLVRNDVQSVPNRARGGLLGGLGSGTSDSNLAWLSRGEYVTPARAVGQPGVLTFLEALRRSGGNLRGVLDGMGRFALGGMVPRMMPAFAAGGLAGGGSHVTIAFPGLPPISGLRASSAVVDELQRAAALAQVRSGGRKPSRYS